MTYGDNYNCPCPCCNKMLHYLLNDTAQAKVGETYSFERTCEHCQETFRCWASYELAIRAEKVERKVKP